MEAPKELQVSIAVNVSEVSMWRASLIEALKQGVIIGQVPHGPMQALVIVIIIIFFANLRLIFLGGTCLEFGHVKGPTKNCLIHIYMSKNIFLEPEWPVIVYLVDSW